MSRESSRVSDIRLSVGVAVAGVALAGASWLAAHTSPSAEQHNTFGPEMISQAAAPFEQLLYGTGEVGGSALALAGTATAVYLARRRLQEEQ